MYIEEKWQAKSGWCTNTLRLKIDKKLNSLHYTTIAQQLLKNTDPNVDHHAGWKWFIHGPKRRKQNQLQSLELSYWLT